MFAEKGRYKSHRLADPDLFSVRDGESRAFLSAVLQGVKSHGDIARDIFTVVDSDDAAFFVKFIQHGSLFDVD